MGREERKNLSRESVGTFDKFCSSKYVLIIEIIQGRMTIQIQFRISNKIDVVFPEDFMNTCNKSFSLDNIEGTK